MSTDNNFQNLLNSWSANLAESVSPCPCPPETVKPALVAVDGDILNVVKKLKQIKIDIDLINAGAFDASLFTDEQHYSLLEIDLALEAFLAPFSYSEHLQ